MKLVVKSRNKKNNIIFKKLNVKNPFECINDLFSKVKYENNEKLYMIIITFCEDDDIENARIKPIINVAEKISDNKYSLTVEDFVAVDQLNKILLRDVVPNSILEHISACFFQNNFYKRFINKKFISKYKDKLNENEIKILKKCYSGTNIYKFFLQPNVIFVNRNNYENSINIRKLIDIKIEIDYEISKILNKNIENYYYLKFISIVSIGMRNIEVEKDLLFSLFTEYINNSEPSLKYFESMHKIIEQNIILNNRNRILINDLTVFNEELVNNYDIDEKKYKKFLATKYI